VYFLPDLERSVFDDDIVGNLDESLVFRTGQADPAAGRCLLCYSSEAVQID
jgi:hypothetical protein